MSLDEGATTREGEDQQVGTRKRHRFVKVENGSLIILQFRGSLWNCKCLKILVGTPLTFWIWISFSNRNIEYITTLHDEKSSAWKIVL